jgi:dihydropteroate synthase
MGVPMEDRLPSTIVSNILAAQNGADIIRVHDVAEIKQALLMMRYIQGADEAIVNQP